MPWLTNYAAYTSTTHFQHKLLRGYECMNKIKSESEEGAAKGKESQHETLDLEICTSDAVLVLSCAVQCITGDESRESLRHFHTIRIRSKYIGIKG
jgi:hypothetical protein